MTRLFRILMALALIGAVAGTLSAQVEPERLEKFEQKIFKHADLNEIGREEVFHAVNQIPNKSAALDVQRRLVDLKIQESSAMVDAKTGRFVRLYPTESLLPGKGYQNTLTWGDFNKAAAPSNDQELVRFAWDQLRSYLVNNQEALRINPDELPEVARSGVHANGDHIQFHIERYIDGIKVRGSSATAEVKFGNLILLGFERWDDAGKTGNRALMSEEKAREAVLGYLAPLAVDAGWGEAELVYITMKSGKEGYRYVPVWAVKSRTSEDGGLWETLVNAANGNVLAHEDLRHYAEAKGGVYPITNDDINPDGVEQAGWPMPFMQVGSQNTDTGGNYSLTGSQTARLYGPYVNMADNCGTESLTQSGGIDWGTSGGDDCTTPGFGGAGNTHSSRSGFYEINRTKEMARGLISNSWLNGRLTSNMNINSTCNAFWNGSTINFYRSGGGCSNTGEIAGVFVHEWGHGMDANDVVGGIASPSGEGIADIYTALRLDTSCIGRNFRTSVCSSGGKTCNTCTGVRDIDYLAKSPATPSDYSWRNANCGSSVHCTGHVYSEAVWSLWKRILTASPYNYDNNTAHEITNRLTFIAAGNTTTWFSGSPPNGGCSSSNGYQKFLAADDDNGNLNDGTPHMNAIFQAFDDQEIACGSPTVQDSGCSGTPSGQPNVTATPGDTQVSLSWNSISGASEYEVFRAEGIFQCNFGKVRIGSTTGTSFTDTGLQNGRDYSYVVIPKGSSDSCFGNASACDTVQPAAGPACSVNGDCDDGLFCNGAETCSGGQCFSGSDPCSTGQVCNETTDTCETPPACTHSADFTSGTDGWTNGNDSCTTGSFTQGTPNSTDWQVGSGNPGGAYYTQPNSAIGTDDVDGGTCEALSPVVDCSSVSDADISLDYFHGQRDAGDDASDGFTIEILNNGSVVQTLVNIGDVTNTAAWTNVSTTVSNPGNIQIRVRATDAAGPGDIVEGGIDNVSITPGSGGPPPPPPGGCTVDDDFESGTAGWFNDAASTCTTGAFVEGNPTVQTNSGVTTQVGGSNSGSASIFTATNTSAGANDVDGGNCILGSPSWSVANASTLSVAYWFGQRDAGDDASGDFQRVEYSLNGGSSWNTLVSNGDSTSNAAWNTATASIPAGSNVQLRVQCSDGAGPGDLVECGIDDVSICE